MFNLGPFTVPVDEEVEAQHMKFTYSRQCALRLNSVSLLRCIRLENACSDLDYWLLDSGCFWLFVPKIVGGDGVLWKQLV